MSQPYRTLTLTVEPDGSFDVVVDFSVIDLRVVHDPVAETSMLEITDYNSQTTRPSDLARLELTGPAATQIAGTARQCCQTGNINPLMRWVLSRVEDPARAALEAELGATKSEGSGD